MEKGKPQPFFSAAEVAAHNSSKDCWISKFGKVYNLTKLLAQGNHGILARPIIDFAGQGSSFIHVTCFLNLFQIEYHNTFFIFYYFKLFFKIVLFILSS